MERERQAVERTALEVRRKAARVIDASPVATQAVADLEKAEIELVRCGDRVRWLISPGGVFSDEGLARRARIADRRLDRPPTEWRDVLQALHDTSSTTQDWDHLLEALQNDADAVIPGE